MHQTNQDRNKQIKIETKKQAQIQFLDSVQCNNTINQLGNLMIGNAIISHNRKEINTRTNQSETQPPTKQLASFN